MTCPKCNLRTRVIRTTEGDGPGADVTRLRLCSSCRETWTSDERLRSSPGELAKPPPVQAPAPVQVPVQMTPNVRASDASSFLISLPSKPDLTHARSSNGAKFWTAFDWQRKYNAAWASAYNVMHPRGGGDAESRACSDLASQLEAMDAGVREAAQARSGAMFSEFLGDRSKRLTNARHPFSWFVASFAGLVVPAKEPERVETFSEREARAKREAARREAEKTDRDIAATDAKIANYKGWYK